MPNFTIDESITILRECLRRELTKEIDLSVKNKFDEIFANIAKKDITMADAKKI
jgi:hypothetical protein